MAPTNTSENFGGLQHVDQELNTSIDGEFVEIVEKWQTQALKLSCNVYFIHSVVIIMLFYQNCSFFCTITIKLW